MKTQTITSGNFLGRLPPRRQTATNILLRGRVPHRFGSLTNTRRFDPGRSGKDMWNPPNNCRPGRIRDSHCPHPS